MGCSYVKIRFSVLLYTISIIMDWTNTTMTMWGMWTWLIILLLFLFNGNWFGGFWGGANAAWLMWQANNNNNHDNTVDLINNNTLWQNQLFNQQNIANLTSSMNMWFCNTNQNIERAILAWQQNTAQIIAASSANVQRVLDKLCEQETDRLRTQLAEARVIAQNNAQTTELLSKLQPVAIPSYIVSSPYTSIYPPTTTTASNG